MELKDLNLPLPSDLRAALVQEAHEKHYMDDKGAAQYAEAVMFAYSKGVKEVIEILDRYVATKEFKLSKPEQVYKAFAIINLIVPFAVNINAQVLARRQVEAYYQAVADATKALDALDAMMESKNAQHH